MAGTIVVDRIESDASYTSTINVANRITFSNTVNFGVFAGTAPVAGFYLPSTNNLAFTTASTERMRIDSSGNVGIGTSSPTAPLHVNSASNPQIKFGGADATYFWSLDREDSAGDFAISNANGGASTERMRLTAGGNVGIGTSSPTYGTLEVAQGSAGSVSVINNTVGAWAFRKVRSDGSNGMGIYDVSGFGVPAFYASGVERMRIDSGGNLQLGSASAPEPGRLFVSSTSASAVPFVLQQTAAGSTTQNSVVFYRNSGSTGTIQVTGTTTAYNTSSDYRLKENVQPMTGALAKVTAMKPCTYTWKLDGSLGEGFIAHELAEVVPQAVGGEKDAVDSDGKIIPQGIDTSFLVATLTAAIQEQQALITALTARITALENN